MDAVRAYWKARLDPSSGPVPTETRVLAGRRPKTPLCRRGLWGALLLASLTGTGCQVELGGQTLPSPYYLTDDVQYYAPGPEFLLTREAAAQKAFRNEEILKQAP